LTTRLLLLLLPLTMIHSPSRRLILGSATDAVNLLSPSFYLSSSVLTDGFLLFIATTATIAPL